MSSNVNHKIKPVVIVLGALLLAAAAAAVIIFSVNVSGDDSPVLLETFKSGRYLLSRESGLDESEYIEVFDDHTVQFVGSYWSEFDDLYEDSYIGYENGLRYTNRNPYVCSNKLRFVAFYDDPEMLVDAMCCGFGYIDENTLTSTRVNDGDVIGYGMNDAGKSVGEAVTAGFVYVGE